MRYVDVSDWLKARFLVMQPSPLESLVFVQPFPSFVVYLGSIKYLESAVKYIYIYPYISSKLCVETPN
jgi:hypothetical protein